MNDPAIALIRRPAIEGPGMIVEGVRLGRFTVERVWTSRLGETVPFGWIAQWRSHSFLLRTTRSR